MIKPTRVQILQALDAREEGLALTADQKLWVEEHDRLEGAGQSVSSKASLSKRDDMLQSRLNSLGAALQGGRITPEQYKLEVLKSERVVGEHQSKLQRDLMEWTDGQLAQQSLLISLDELIRGS